MEALKNLYEAGSKHPAWGKERWVVGAEGN